jgi:hypothetical protein
MHHKYILILHLFDIIDVDIFSTNMIKVRWIWIITTLKIIEMERVIISQHLWGNLLVS